jgi:predicted DNA-binding protein
MKLNDRLEMRISSEMKSSLVREAGKTGKPYQVLVRELIAAFLNDTLRIKGKPERSIYSDN